MLYKITQIQKTTTRTGKELAKVSAVDVSGNSLEATIWKLDKEGQVFPNFDSLTANAQIEANQWQNPKDGTFTLYPTKNTANRSFTPNRGGIAQAQQRKETSITISQERKEEGIMISSTIRMAVDITVAEGFENLSEQATKERIMRWRYWLVEKWNQTTPIKVTGTDEFYPENTDEIPFN